MPSVSSSFSDYFTGREVGTEESSGNYSSLKVLCIPSSASVLSALGDSLRMEFSETKNMWDAVLCLIEHLAKQTFHLFPIRNLIRCKRESGASILTRREELLLTLVCLLFRPQSISSFCVPMSSDLLLNGRVQALWGKEDLKVLLSP